MYLINAREVLLVYPYPQPLFWLVILTSPPDGTKTLCCPSSIRELKQRWHWCQGWWCWVKNEFIFNPQNSQLSKSVQYTNGSKNMLRLNMQWWHLIWNGNTRNWTSSLVFLRLRRTWSSRVFLLCKRWQRKVQRFITHMHSYCFAH